MIFRVFCSIFFILFGKNLFTEGSVKVWLPDLNVYNPKNWLNQNADEKCQGFILSQYNEIPLNLNNLKTEQLVLPRDGEVTFESITFVPKSKCIKLKEFKKKYYNDYANWAAENEKNNSAKPHTERVPCIYEDFRVPKSFVQITGRGMQYLTYHLIQKEQGGYFKVKSEEKCADKSGCLCGNDEEDVCLYAESEAKLNCKNPIIPIGFCNHICGAQILLNPKNGFELETLRYMLNQYTDIDVYASKVFNRTHLLIQAIFTEKKFMGDSLIYAKEFYEKINENFLKVVKVEIKSSGEFYVEGMVDNSGLSIFFGTLFGVILTFVIIVVYYNTGIAKKNIINRFNFRNRNLNGFFTNARYNIHRSNLSFENQSLNSSVMSLEKSFDNPMYQENETPGTSNYGSMNTGDFSRESSEHENPLYDLKNEKTEEKENILDNIEEEIE